MEPAVIGARLASSVVSPLFRKLFLNGVPEAGVVDKSVRGSRFVAVRDEQRTLSDKARHRTAEELVARAVGRNVAVVPSPPKLITLLPSSSPTPSVRHLHD
ncbi:NACHT N-terminal Helical domain 1-containing protein [Streptomyces sp. NBC_01716]|uniref:NACHT N-terminal Helical domain 1-containing protein n=1 Tax=Streptomyces sp. NBC_01716 TaxID=2975917 RepID=UPI003FCD561D